MKLDRPLRGKCRPCRLGSGRLLVEPGRRGHMKRDSSALGQACGMTGRFERAATLAVFREWRWCLRQGEGDDFVGLLFFRDAAVASGCDDDELLAALARPVGHRRGAAARWELGGPELFSGF